MLSLTTPDGRTITADTDVELASRWLDAQHGDNWADGLIPFDEHDAMNSTIEELALMQDGLFPGYTVTEH
ncbi:hypothetical protein SCB71_21315 (plasmid) [Herbiconiux sp. KACC 21604]|uniref:hypothetical protein n=1 Tax=unclassified Herbiconiux TaxID=2618217 RepID=UPI00149219E4|nr:MULTISPECIES: hypothetical protein [unclassified Herbiconiux]QJU56286.1 hypothetical protein HL652_21115 [Herbiconiux sp. SALV-R1]WPO88790.1 hypothetical protein SCB71_21315 [Herbiconiux sp. KACC 21604]